jgi:hypothetical protein
MDQYVSHEDLACRGVVRPGTVASRAPRAAVPPDRPADERAASDARSLRVGMARGEDGANDPANIVVRAFASALRGETDASSIGAASGGDGDALRADGDRPAGLADVAEPGELVTVESAELRAALREYVIGLKADGAPPERAVIAVKAAAAQGALAAGHASDARREAAALTERVVRWAVLAYYAEPGA